MAVDVTAGQRPSIWSTGLIGDTALCRRDIYDGHLRAESHDTAAANFANKVTGCRGHNGRFSPTEMKYLFQATEIQNLFISKDAQYCTILEIIIFLVTASAYRSFTFLYYRP